MKDIFRSLAAHVDGVIKSGWSFIDTVIYYSFAGTSPCLSDTFGCIHVATVFLFESAGSRISFLHEQVIRIVGVGVGIQSFQLKQGTCFWKLFMFP